MKNQSVNIVYLGVEIEVNGNYSPEEPMVKYYKDGSGYPGSSSEFEVLEATIGGQNAEEIIEKLNAWDELAELARQKIEDNEMY